MAEIRPFCGLRPSKELVLAVVAPPYDVVNSQEARAYAKGNSNSFFRISRPEVDLPPTIDEHDEQVYLQGRKNLEEFIQRGVLRADAQARFYVYRQKMGTHVQTGVVAAASVAEYDQGIIKKHELTRQDKEDDRTHHIDVLGANDEPVFLTYRANAAVDALVLQVAQTAAEYEFTTEDDITHTFWLTSDEQTENLRSSFQSIPVMYIADGHHRSAAASRVAKLRAGKNGNQSHFLSVIFPHNQMQILPYNRLVKDLAGFSPAEFLEKLKADFDVTENGNPKPVEPHSFGLYLTGKWYRLRAKPHAVGSTPTGVLDVSILQERVLSPLLKIGEPRTDKRIDFVGGIRGSGELEKRVNSKEWAAAFSLFPTSIEQLMSIADAGEIMPPKSTWFEPKLRSGLVVHRF